MGNNGKRPNYSPREPLPFPYRPPAVPPPPPIRSFPAAPQPQGSCRGATEGSMPYPRNVDATPCKPTPYTAFPSSRRQSPHFCPKNRGIHPHRPPFAPPSPSFHEKIFTENTPDNQPTADFPSKKVKKYFGSLEKGCTFASVFRQTGRERSRASRGTSQSKRWHGAKREH